MALFYWKAKKKRNIKTKNVGRETAHPSIRRVNVSPQQL
jgi:hypothetical protein